MYICIVYRIGNWNKKHNTKCNNIELLKTKKDNEEQDLNDAKKRSYSDDEHCQLNLALTICGQRLYTVETGYVPEKDLARKQGYMYTCWLNVNYSNYMKTGL